VTGRLLEFGQQRLEHAAHGPGRQNLDLSGDQGLGAGGEREGGEDETA
jgi:hypothetical protein